jgi:autophagy-related protein 16
MLALPPSSRPSPPQEAGAGGDEVVQCVGSLVGGQVENRKTEELNQKLQEENNLMMNRWKQKTSEEAHTMNAANDLYNQMLEANKRAQLLQKIEGTTRPLSADASPSRSTAHPPVPRKVDLRLKGHKGEISSLVFGAGADRFLSGSADKTVKLWDGRDRDRGKLLATLSGATQGITSVAFSSAGDLIAGASADNTARIWRSDTARLRHVLTSHIGKVTSAAFYPAADKLLTASHDRTLKVWDVGRGSCMKTIFCVSSCNDVCLVVGGTVAASAHRDGVVRIWDAGTGDLVREVEDIHSKQLSAVCGSADGLYLLTASRDDTLRLLDVRTFRPIHCYKHKYYRSTLSGTRPAFSPDASLVCAGAADGCLYFWETQTGTAKATSPEAHPGGVTCVAWAGRRIISGGVDQQIVIWAD